ncbi:MAG TPA: hypothetical protein VIM08_09960 [Arthrobacter sp.]
MARRSKDVPQDPDYIAPDRRKGSYSRAENGELAAYSPEEYGVRKDDGLGLVKPVNSSAGLLILAVLISLAFGGMLYGIVQMAITDQWEILGEIWWMYLLILVPLVGGWSSYLKERRAEKLRKARDLPRPVE